MKTKYIIALSLLLSSLLMMNCTEQPYFDIPRDANGNVILSDISVVTSDGVTMADNEFTINGYFPNAKPGDVLEAEVLKYQVPSWDPDGATQLLPLDGTKKSIEVDASLNASVTYTRAEAGLVEVGDFVTIVFSGATDSGIIKITLEE